MTQATLLSPSDLLRKIEPACDAARFLQDAKNHQMTVIRDDGVHRHLRFKRPNESAFWFDVITWPGSLCIDGDVGTFVFRRLNDMFEFFRTDLDYGRAKGQELSINPDYWAEKLQAPRSSGAESFSPARFRQRVKEAFDDWRQTHQVTQDDVDLGDATQEELNSFNTMAEALWSRLEDEVLSSADDNETRAFDAAYAFKDKDAKFSLSDCWEWRCKEYNFDFLWCCYAVSWAVQVYDREKAPAN